MTGRRSPTALRAQEFRDGVSPLHRIVFPYVSKRLWEAQREHVLTLWLRRWDGTRPPAWWAYDAPGLREQVGGRGTRIAGNPRHASGIPTGWAWIDRGDPPLFEAQAIFLERHGLMFPGEARKLPRGPRNPEPLPRQFWPALFPTDTECEEFPNDHD